MAYQTKFEAVRTQAVESKHTSLGSTDGNDHSARDEPQALSWWQASKFFGVLIDLLAIVLSCAFFVYGLAVKMHQNTAMDSPRVKLLVKLSNLVSGNRLLCGTWLTNVHTGSHYLPYSLRRRHR
jgi:hypothetical protein